jgi:DMSO reductase anchor subunit
MIYHDTQRAFWSIEQSGTKFLLTTLMLGVAATLLMASMDAALLRGGEKVARGDASRLLLWMLASVSAAKLLFEAGALRHLADRRQTAARKTARLLIGPLSRITAARFLVGAFGGILLPLLAAADSTISLLLSLAVFVLTLTGELLERYLFFAAVVAPRMPGVVSQ